MEDKINTMSVLVAVRKNPHILLDLINQHGAIKHPQFARLLAEAVNADATLLSADDRKYWLDFNLLYLLLDEQITTTTRDILLEHIKSMETDKCNYLASKIDMLWLTLIPITTISHDIRIRMLYVMKDHVARNRMIKKCPELGVQK